MKENRQILTIEEVLEYYDMDLQYIIDQLNFCDDEIQHDKNHKQYFDKEFIKASVFYSLLYFGIISTIIEKKLTE